MNLIKLFLILAFFCVVSFSAQAQNVKPEFKKLIYVPYFLQLSGKDTVHYIGEHLEINGDGQAHYTRIYGNHVAEARDSTYQLPDTLVTKLNKIFNGKSNLESYRIADRLPNGYVYKGQLIYISFTDMRGKVHQYIDVKPYMSKEFNATLAATIRIAKNITRKDIVLDDKALVDEIIKTQEDCKYCSKIEQPSNEPPSVQHLEIANPQNKH